MCSQGGSIDLVQLLQSVRCLHATHPPLSESPHRPSALYTPPPPVQAPTFLSL